MSSISERGLDWEAWAASSVLRVRTSPECPECHEDSLRELTWYSNPNCGIARERKKKRIFPQKALMCSLSGSQNKGLSEYQMRASWLCTGSFLSPPLEAERQACEAVRAGRQGAISAQRQASFTKLSRLLVANYVFLGSWMVDICQEGRSLRSVPQGRHTAHLRWCSPGTPGKLSRRDWGGD